MPPLVTLSIPLPVSQEAKSITPEPQQCSNPTQILVSIHGSVLCNAYVSSVLLSLDEYKSKVVCEEERMRLSCKRGMQIAVYSAMFGRTQQGTLECPLHHRRAPSVDCQSLVALQVLTARCQGKKSCLVRASTRDFGEPCYSGTRKYLSVIYTCGESLYTFTEG
uniref:SUEL-type lectin domain-containing protein n=1 Tax=Cyclopterus lumpus TaxID=8103 RepID=A0A8C2ZZV1_CYCLU